jgi:hypothetical protein
MAKRLRIGKKRLAMIREIAREVLEASPEIAHALRNSTKREKAAS